MATDAQLEVYRQRYETFRHLDKLRWQMLQISIASGSLVLAFGASGTATSEISAKWWVFAIVGVLLLMFAVVMERIRSGIANNSIVLKKAGEAVGDDSIPLTICRWKSFSFWVAVTIAILGLISLLAALLLRGAT